VIFICALLMLLAAIVCGHLVYLVYRTALNVTDPPTTDLSAKVETRPECAGWACRTVGCRDEPQ
jgi:hypothetical protein